MYKQFYASLDFAWLPTLTLLFFLGVFAVAILRLFLFKTRHDFDAVASLPLEREEKPT